MQMSFFPKVIFAADTNQHYPAMLPTAPHSKSIWRKLLHYAGPALAVFLLLFVELDPKKPQLTATLAVAIWMACWWVAEIAPLAITSLLPVALFPLLGIMNGKAVSSTYFNHVIFLFIGGFIVALAIQKWNLHKRIALGILRITGSSPGRILLGFMFATAFLSMWISNTATVMLLIPILLSMLSKVEELNGRENAATFSIGMLLAVAYSASIGGIATLVGTPPNLSFSRILYIYFPQAPEITFANWFLYAFPITLLLFVFLWIYLYFLYIRPKGKWVQLTGEDIRRQYRELGPMSFEEIVLSIAFITLALLWFFRADITLGSWKIPGWSTLLQHPKYVKDGTVAIAVAIVLFLIPSRSKKGEYLMDWETAKGIPWGIVLLFGGGFALATGFKESGLSLWLGQQLVWLKDYHPIFLISTVSAFVTFLTELTSNTATVETILPVLSGLAVSIKLNPLLLMLPATIAGSLAFMLPVATPPNAIAFGTQRLPMIKMIKAGFFLNLLGILVVTLVTYFPGMKIFHLLPGVFPDWAQ